MGVKKDHNHQSLGQVLQKLVNTYKLGDKMRELDLVHAWEEVMGKMVAKRTSVIYVKDKILFLKLSSAPLKEELQRSKSKLVTTLNEKVGVKVIEDIHFL